MADAEAELRRWAGQMQPPGLGGPGNALAPSRADVLVNGANEIARLRAVNAELVAALKDTLRIADAATLHSGGEHNRKRIAAARAAIAKATGA